MSLRQVVSQMCYSRDAYLNGGGSIVGGNV